MSIETTNGDEVKQTFLFPNGWRAPAAEDMTGGLTVYIKAIRGGETWALEAGDKRIMIPRSEFHIKRRSRMNTVLEYLLGPIVRLRNVGRGPRGLA